MKMNKPENNRWMHSIIRWNSDYELAGEEERNDAPVMDNII